VATLVLTFEPHPLSVVAPGKAPPSLTPLPEKLEQLAAAGADITVVAKADPNLLTLTPEEFINRVVARLSPVHIVEGTSFGFGRGRSGDAATLRRLGAEHGFMVTIVDPVRVTVDGGTTVEVSSSAIRRFIAEGRVEHAARCLGRAYTLIGEVVSGAGRGRQIGVPTANMGGLQQLVPGDGVYAGFARIHGKSSHERAPIPAAISIGTTPTFEDAGGRCVEVHLLDTEADLYNRQIRLEFGIRLRGQRKFASPADLVGQISRDIEAVRRFAGKKLESQERA
jgi:riboflavin kinase/FMN adenylyltransferase